MKHSLRAVAAVVAVIAALGALSSAQDTGSRAPGAPTIPGPGPSAARARGAEVGGVAGGASVRAAALADAEEEVSKTLGLVDESGNRPDSDPRAGMPEGANARPFDLLRPDEGIEVDLSFLSDDLRQRLDGAWKDTRWLDALKRAPGAD
jgi:hypothetical protein